MVLERGGQFGPWCFLQVLLVFSPAGCFVFLAAVRCFCSIGKKNYQLISMVKLWVSLVALEEWDRETLSLLFSFAEEVISRGLDALVLEGRLAQISASRNLWRWENHKKGGLNCVFGNFFFYVQDNCPQVQSLKEFRVWVSSESMCSG